MARPIDSQYRDPLELVWLRAVHEVGYVVERSHGVYASFDGTCTLSITHAEHFDPDDCLGQMLFHELCHALVAGPEGRKQQDWGLENTDYRDAVQEKATNRLQAALTRPHGLRSLFGTTTDFRDYYDALPEDPLGEGDDPAIAIARRAYAEAQTPPWHDAIQGALRRTAELAAIASEIAPPDSLWRKLRRVVPALALAAGISWLTAGVARADVAVITRVPEDAEVERQLAGLLDEPVRERTEPADRRLPDIVRDAASWPERYVVIVDRENDSVHALRPSDQTIVSRVLPQGVLLEAHYAVALAAAELLEWLGATPRAEVELAKAGATTTGTPPPAPTPEAEPATQRSALGFAAGAGLELSASPGFDPSLTRLALEAGIELERMRAPTWVWLGARASLFGSSVQSALPETQAGVDEIVYRSHEVALHGALGLGAGGAALAVGPVVGVSLVGVRAEDRRGRTLGEHDQKSVFLGAALWLRYPLTLGFGLSLGADAQWLMAPARYRIEGENVLEEGALRAQARLGVVWESPLL